MSNISLEISIPLDKDGFMEMECDFCKNRFMLHKDVYESEDNINFFCPICGLPNKTNTFFCPEVLEKAQQKALNYCFWFHLFERVLLFGYRKGSLTHKKSDMQFFCW